MVGGEAVTITVQVANTGAADAPDYSLSYRLDSGTATVVTLPAIAAGDSATFGFQVTSASTGTRTVTATADSTSTISEGDETDNTGTVAIIWANNVQNFAIISATVSDNTLQIGDTATVPFTVSCQWDTIIAIAIVVDWRIVRVDAPNVALAHGTFSVPIGGSASPSVPASFVDPGAVGAVVYQLQLDYTDTQDESAEADNTADLTITWSASG